MAPNSMSRSRVVHCACPRLTARSLQSPSPPHRGGPLLSFRNRMARKAGKAMTQQEIARLFDELSVVADSVNADSDTVTQLICEFEERLNELRLGVEAWVKVSESVT